MFCSTSKVSQNLCDIKITIVAKIWDGCRISYSTHRVSNSTTHTNIKRIDMIVISIRTSVASGYLTQIELTS
jgi:hypothetical protein